VLSALEFVRSLETPIIVVPTAITLPSSQVKSSQVLHDLFLFKFMRSECERRISNPFLLFFGVVSDLNLT
jgi:hypothetical protein